MPLELQAKLLRVLEQREVERLGGNDAGARSTCASSRRRIATCAGGRGGQFREDLFYRLAVFPISRPAACGSGPTTSLPLARAFAAELRGRGELRVTPEGATAVRRHPWPGNVRELRNFVERLHLLRDAGPLVVDEDAARLLSERGGRSEIRLSTASAPSPSASCARKPNATSCAKLGALRRERGGAARLLKVDRGNLFRRIKALGVEASE